MAEQFARAEIIHRLTVSARGAVLARSEDEMIVKIWLITTLLSYIIYNKHKKVYSISNNFHGGLYQYLESEVEEG